MSRKILGLDISDTAVSGVLVSSSLKGDVVTVTARVPLGEGAEPANALNDALEQITAGADIAGAVCNVSLPASQFYFRNLAVPFHEPKKIRQVLPFELEPILPRPAEELVVDFLKNGVTGRAHANMLAAAVEKSRIRSVLEVLAARGLDPETITVSGFPLALCLADTPGIPADWVLCDLDRHTLSVLIAADNEVALARATLINAAKGNALNPEVSLQVKRTLLAFADSHAPDFQPAALFTTGSGFAGPELKQTLAGDLAISPGNLKLAENPRLASILSPPGRNVPDWDVPEDMAGALALVYLELAGRKGFNFRRGPFERKRQWAVHRKSIITTGLAALLLAMFALANTFLDTYLLEKEVNRLNKEITAVFKAVLPEVKRIVNPLQQMQVKLKGLKEKQLPLQTRQRQRAIDLIREMSVGIPPGVDAALTRVVIGEGGLQITGHTDTFNAVDNIQASLTKRTVFKKVTISSANLAKSGNRISFKLKVDL